MLCLAFFLTATIVRVNHAFLIIRLLNDSRLIWSVGSQFLVDLTKGFCRLVSLGPFRRQDRVPSLLSMFSHTVFERHTHGTVLKDLRTGDYDFKVILPSRSG